MDGTPLTTSLEGARRLVVVKQRLAGKPPARVSANSIVDLVRDLGFVQWDPISVVAPSHLLSIRSRLGNFDPAVLERLLWSDKKLFEHWTPIASLVLTEDYPLYYSLMRRYPASMSRSWGSQGKRAAKFLRDNADLRRRMLRELREGPRTLGSFTDHVRTKRADGEWAPTSDVAQMLYHLTMTGEVMVVGHEGNQNLWGLTTGFLPSWARRVKMPADEFEAASAERAILAQGIATPRETLFYFVRGRYETLDTTLEKLERSSRIRRIQVEGLDDRKTRYIHAQDVPLLESLAAGKRWEPRLSLLPPFDNLVGNQDRLQRLFGFRYIREQFFPPEKRQFGFYVLPVLRGERFIGRIDPRMDRESETLVINSVHAEPGAPMDRSVGVELRDAIDDLANFVGAARVAYTSQVPGPWKGVLH
ncbi:MAG TPA: crosslink repair DNA glycosylase YcaQ family protein [Thermoplasmata archaeon]|nr:crosslink repair DNA glycosylase YcaQ family protein [Thermoplasmata archaeon]